MGSEQYVNELKEFLEPAGYETTLLQYKGQQHGNRKVILDLLIGKFKQESSLKGFKLSVSRFDTSIDMMFYNEDTNVSGLCYFNNGATIDLLDKLPENLRSKIKELCNYIIQFTNEEIKALPKDFTL